MHTASSGYRMFVSSLALSACVSLSHASPVAGQTLQPADWDEAIKLPQAPDHNSDPRIVEINLEAVPAVVPIGSHRVAVWTYNGGLPGPLIRGRVGDRLIVHFRNALPEPTTVHWHGLRVP